MSAITVSEIEHRPLRWLSEGRPADCLRRSTGGGGVDALHQLLTEQLVGSSTSVTILRATEKITLPIVPEEAREQDAG